MCEVRGNNVVNAALLKPVLRKRKVVVELVHVVRGPEAVKSIE